MQTSILETEESMDEPETVVRCRYSSDRVPFFQMLWRIHAAFRATCLLPLLSLGRAIRRPDNIAIGFGRALGLFAFQEIFTGMILFVILAAAA